RCICLGCVHSLDDGVEYGDRALEPLAAFPWRHTRDDFRAVLHHLLCVERSVAAGDSLHDEAGRSIAEDAHVAFPLDRATACFTASSMSVNAENPARSRIAMPSRSFVPVSRMTIGTLSGNSFVASTMPLATSSPRVMPPKMLKRIALTFGSPVMMLSALTTFWGFELPPMSRKLAGAPP